jgi:hypothetical protein
MDVVSLCPLRVASLVWRASSGGFALTVICKATFDLRPGELRLAEQQEDPNEDDNFWDDDPNRSVRSSSDLVPFKPHADVMLVGQAFAAGKAPVRSLLARLAVTGVDKTVEVCGDRMWTPEGGLREGPPFTSMQLRWERAAGGPENPVGVRVDGRAGGPLPNLQMPGGGAGSAGFGPVAPRWPGRRAKLGRHAGSFPPRRWQEELVPEDLDASFFNAAPPDQQVERIEPGAVLLLEHLHPQHPRLVAELSKARPRAFVDRGGGLEEVSLTCDTLWIDTDRAVCTLTWRGQIGLHGPGDEGRVTFLLDQPARPLAWPEIQRQCARRPAPSFGVPGALGESPQPSSRPEPAQPAPPSVAPPPVEDAGRSGSEGTREYHVKRLVPSRSDAALPFVSNAAAEPPSAPRPSASVVPPWLEAKTAAPVVSEMGGETLLPGALRVPARWPRAEPTASVPAPTPPPRRSDPPPPLSSQPPQPPLVMPPPLAAPAVVPIAKLVTSAPPLPVPEPAVTPPAERPPAARAQPGEVIDLIWFDPATPDRARVHLPWQELIAKLRPVPPAPERDEEVPEPPPEVVARGDVFAVVTDADPTSLDDLDQCLAAATSPRGAFEPALALVTGELELTFDDLETLKATLAAVAPFSAGPDKKLKDAFDAAGEALKSPFLQTTGRAVESLVTRLRETFAQGSWNLPAGWLDQQVERALVEQRRYQKRGVLGETWIRALLGPRGAAVPTYLPEALAPRLPLYARFPARLVVEVHLQQDGYESHPAALRALALARVVPARPPPRAPGRSAAR